MKRDYYSDIRMVERIIYDNSLYLLSGLDKKVQSFTSQKTPNMRHRERLELLHSDNVLQLEDINSSSAVYQLGSDLTKPLGNRMPNLDTVVICSVPDFNAQSQKEARNNSLKYILQRFFERLKNEHQDERSYFLNLRLIKNERDCHHGTEEQKRKIFVWIHELLDKIFRLVSLEIAENQQNEVMRKQLQDQQAFLKKLLIISAFQGQESLKQYQKEVKILSSFVETIEQQLNATLECMKGPVLINFWPEIQGLSKIIHPMLIAIYVWLRNQFKPPANSLDSNKIEPEQKMKDSIFQQLNFRNCSRITFINLDGYDSPLNLILSKYLNSYVQYISFPIDQSASLAKQFIIGDANFQQLRREASKFQVKQSEKEVLFYYKALFVFPLFSSFLSQQLDLPDISPYYSSFINLMMKEVLYRQIRQFNPSMIVISHSGELSIKSAHFESILKELAVITNTKLVLYNNFDHQKLIVQPVSQFQNARLKLQLFDHMAMFLKIVSGTYSLQQTELQDPKIQKLETCCILEYASKMLQFVGRNHPILEKLMGGFKELLNRSQLQLNFKSYQPTFAECSSSYHIRLVENTQNILKNPLPQYYSQVREVKQKYGGNLERHWSFFIQRKYALELKSQQELETVKYIAKLPIPKELKHLQRTYDLITLEFELEEQAGGPPVFIHPRSQILLSQARKKSFSTIFLLNHLPGKKYPNLNNYAGFLNNSIQESCQKRISLRKVEFEYELGEHFHFCQFNFVETANYVILFWPLLYDQKKALLHSFAGTKYSPVATSLIFVGRIDNPFYLKNVKSSKESFVHPRTGCTCYQPTESQKIYVFGGFYNDYKDYLDFQTDITVFEVTAKEELLVENVPKQFYLSCQPLQGNGVRITKLHNDFIRPRVEYEVYEKKKQQDFSQILLVGGVGEKFIRPFSMLSYLAHSIMFHNDVIFSINRIKVNNIIAANLSRPTYQKGDSSVLTLMTGQNRRLTANEVPSNSNELSFLSFALKYSEEEKRMVCTKNYELGIRKGDIYGEGNRQYEKCLYYYFSYRGLNYPQVLPLYEQMGKQQQQLRVAYELDKQHAEQFINEVSNKISLQIENILAFDCCFNQLYALLQHPIYTEGKVILARSDPYYANTFENIQDKYLSLKQIYCFDANLSRYALKVFQKQTIVIVRGADLCKMPEFVLRRDNAGFFYSLVIRASQDSLKQLSKFYSNVSKFNDASTVSFMFGSKLAMLCFTWISLAHEAVNVQKIGLMIEELLVPLAETIQPVGWELKASRTIFLSFAKSVESNQMPKESLKIQFVDMFQQTERMYQLVVLRLGVMFIGKIDLGDQMNENVIEMTPIQVQFGVLTEQLYKTNRINNKDVNFGKFIEKTPDCQEAVTEIEIQNQ